MKLHNLVLCSALLLSPLASAQEVTLRLDGEVLGGRGFNFSNYWRDIGHASLFITYDTSVTPTSEDEDDFFYHNSIKNMRLELYAHDSGELLDIGVPLEITADPARDTSNRFYTSRYTEEYQGETIEYLRVISRITYEDEDNAGFMRVTVREVPAQFTVNPVPVMNSFSMFPTYNSDEAFANNFSVTIDNNRIYEDIQFTIERIGYVGELVIDGDGDGVADEADLCPVSITDETVSFGDGSVVADVENVYDANGCSIMDHYAACEVVEEEAPRRGIRSVRSGPSSCEKAVSYDLVADGVISYSEARVLRDALYESSTMTQPR